MKRDKGQDAVSIPPMVFTNSSVSSLFSSFLFYLLPTFFRSLFHFRTATESFSTLWAKKTVIVDVVF
jgi:uncharacterized protein YqhQ